MKKFIQLPLYLTILSTFNAQAQTPELQSVTVVGTVLDSPAAVEVTEYGTPFSIVTDQAIRQQNALDFNAALKNVPGVLTSQTTMLGQGTGASLFIRGRGASHPSPDMAIQFDGVPRMGALYGQTLGDGIALNTVGGGNGNFQESRTIAVWIRLCSGQCPAQKDD